MESEYTKSKIRNINNQFKEDIKFVTAEELSKAVEVMVEKILNDAESQGIDQISILQRRINQTTVHRDGTSEDLYNMQISCHVPNTMNDLIMYDASLITYTIGTNGRREQEIDFLIGSSVQAENLSKLDPEQIEQTIDLLLKEGNENYARLISNTYDAYFKIKEREEQQTIGI